VRVNHGFQTLKIGKSSTPNPEPYRAQDGSGQDLGAKHVGDGNTDGEKHDKNFDFRHYEAPLLVEPPTLNPKLQAPSPRPPPLWFLTLNPEP
jgi:hypothetical protein